MKTLAIRLDDDQHARLSMIAQLEELNISDAIRQAIDGWIEARRNNPDLKARAQAVLEDIEHDAATRRGAIADLLGDKVPGPPPKGPSEAKASPRSSRAKPQGRRIGF